MPDILVRDVPTRVLNKLKKQASQRGRSLQREVYSILTGSVEPKFEYDWSVADQIKQSLKGKKFPDSAEIIRKDRQR